MENGKLFFFYDPSWVDSNLVSQDAGRFQTVRDTACFWQARNAQCVDFSVQI